MKTVRKSTERHEKKIYRSIFYVNLNFIKHSKKTRARIRKRDIHSVTAVIAFERDKKLYSKLCRKSSSYIAIATATQMLIKLSKLSCGCLFDFGSKLVSLLNKIDR